MWDNGWKNDSVRGTECRYYSDRMYLGLVLKTDYDFKGIFAITVLYLFRNRKKAQMWAGVIIFLLMDSLEMFAALSFILIWFYNGTRGRQNKYFFYFFYPAHLLLLWRHVWQWELWGNSCNLTNRRMLCE